MAQFERASRILDFIIIVRNYVDLEKVLTSKREWHHSLQSSLSFGNLLPLSYSPGLLLFFIPFQVALQTTLSAMPESL